MLPTLGEERRATYSPFLPISPKTGRVLQVPTLERHVERGTIVFEDEDGDADRGPGHRRPREDAVAARLGHALDGAGRRLRDERQGPDRQRHGCPTRSARCWAATPPEGFNYELFLDENNQKISKSKGNGLTMEDWLRYGAPESLAYYMFQSPEVGQAAVFRRHPQGDGRVSAAARRLQPAGRGGQRARLDNPVWHVHAASPPEQRLAGVSFSLLLNLVSAADASDKAILWGFLQPLHPGRDAARPSRCSTGWPTTRSTITRTS